MRFKAIIVALCFALSPADAQITLRGSGATTSGGGGGYVGPSDTLAGVVDYWGLDSFTSAYRGSKAINLCNVGDVACADVNLSGTTGLVPNAPVIGGVTCGLTVGVNVCTIKTFYGQNGIANQAQATIANRAVFTPSCIGSNPCATSVLATFYTTSANISVGQPFTFIGAAERTGATTAETAIVQCFGSATAVMDFDNSSGLADLFAGATLTASQTESAFHTFQGVFNSTSSVFAVDATQTSGDAGTSGGSAGQPCYIMGNSGTNGTAGNFLGGGVWNAGATTGNMTTINTNYHSRWGY